MSDKIPKLASPEKILPALIHHYSLENPAASISDTTRLIELLSTLPSLSAEDHLDTLAVQLETHDPDGVFSKDDMAVISFVDLSVTEVLTRADLGFKVESFIQNLAPGVAALGLTKDIDAVTDAAISSLKPDAWITLSIMEGVQTPCKLVAIIASNQTYIFANRAGLKVAEYTASQLAHMIVTENSEILDTGAEFESALETVVSGLRENKSKSYEELIGDSS